MNGLKASGICSEEVCAEDKINAINEKRKQIVLDFAKSKAREQRTQAMELKRMGYLDPCVSAGGKSMVPSTSAYLLASLKGVANMSCPVPNLKSYAESEISEEDEIMELLGGDRDLYTSLMIDLEAALESDLLEEEAIEESEYVLQEMNDWEEQVNAEAHYKLVDYEASLQQCAEWSRGCDTSLQSFCNKETYIYDMENSMHVLVNEDSQKSLSNMTVDEIITDVTKGDNCMGGTTTDDETGEEVDYLVCPVCKRQCMLLQKSKSLATCPCGVSLQINRRRFVDALRRNCHTFLTPIENSGPSCLSIAEVKAIIAESLDAHSLSCSSSFGPTIDQVEFTLDNSNSPIFPADGHPHLLLRCLVCSKNDFVL